MLFPAKMAEVEVLVHDSVKYDVLRAMQRGGFIHITHHGIKDLKNSSPSKETSKIVDFQFRISKLMGFLNIAKEKNGGIKEILNPTPPEIFETTSRKREEILKDAEATLKDLEEKIWGLGKRWDEINDELESIKTKREHVKLLRGLDFDLSFIGEDVYVNITAGIVKDISPLLKLKSKNKLAVWYKTIGKKKNIVYVVVVAYHLKERRDVEAALRFATFSEFSLDGLKGKPTEAMKSLDEREEELLKKKEKLKEEIREMREKHYGHLAILYDDLENEKIKEENQSKFGKTEYTTVIRGYIKKKTLEKSIERIKEASKGLAHIEWKDAKGEETPSAFDNPRIFHPFQAFVEMYSTPKYGYIDPTIIIAPLFVVYFGLTLGDAGYGFIMTVLGYLLWFKIGKYDWTNRTLGKILFASGISAIVFGIIQGGIFGPLDSNNPMSQFIQYQPIIDPMKDAVTVLVIALIIGISQISLGLLLGAYHHLKYKNYGDFLTSEVSWFLLLPSSAVVIGSSFGWWTFDPNTILISWIVLAIGLIFLTGIPGRLVDKEHAINAMAFFDITGMVGDWLSYSRLLALDLGTSGIALTINLFAGIMTSMIVGAGSMVCCLPLVIVGIALFGLVARKKDNKKTGIALFLLILGIIGMVSIQAALWLFIGIYLVVAHIGNALLQSLGSLVHSLRLQYVEFFSRFYEGDGVKFEPFREIRKNSRIVESGGAKK